MMKLCVVESSDGRLYARENEQRLLRNMGVHAVVLDLLKIPYDKVSKIDKDEIVFIDLHLGGRYSHELYNEIGS